jgi:hypothetical protein
MKTTIITITLMAFTLILGCDDDTSSNNTNNSDVTPATTTEVQSLCDAACDFEVTTCDEDACGECGLVIEDNIYRKEFVDTLTTCLASAVCDDGEECVFSGLFAVTGGDINNPTPLFNNEDVVACKARYEECNKVFADDLCTTLVALVPSQLETANACLENSCETIETCLESAGTFDY